MAFGLLAGGCSSPHHAARPPGPQQITVDNWTPPPITGPPSTANFCTVLVSSYEHVGTADRAADLKIEKEILQDFVTELPKIVAEAPAPIAASAAYYFDNEGEFLASFIQAGLNSAKIRSGSTSPDLLSPKMDAASKAVITFAQKNCNYTIGG